MWKVVAFLLAVFVFGQFAVRFVRKNPLDPVIDGSYVSVESQDYEVRFQRSGAVAGTYFLDAAKSADWTTRPVNARLEVHGLQVGSDYLRSYPDFKDYGSATSARLSSLATPLALVAARRETYGLLRALLSEHERRAREGGERLCLTLSGEALTIAGAESLDDGRDVTAMLERANGDEPIVYVDELEVDDCSSLIAAGAR